MSLSPPRRSRSNSPRPRGGGGRDVAREPATGTSIMIRNLPKSITPDDMRYYAEKYGPVRDVYLPRDYYTQQPRGLGFVEYHDPRDAADAVRHLDRMELGGREINCNFAMHGRKRPEEIRRGGGGGGRGGYGGGGYGGGSGYGGGGYDRRGGGGGGGGYDRGYDRGHDRHRDRGYGGSRRGRSVSRSRSPVRRRGRSYSRSKSPAPRRARSYSRSRSPVPARKGRSASRSASPARSVSRSPDRGASPGRARHDDEAPPAEPVTAAYD